MVPAQLPVDGQQHRKFGTGVILRRGAQRGADALNIREGEAGFVGILRQVSFRWDLHVLDRPAGEPYQFRRLVVVELDAAGVCGKEAEFRAHD